MGDMFRSEEMALCQMFVQPEAAYASVAELGENGCVQFRDLNGDVNSFQRKFVSEVRRCDELERRIRYIENELRKDEINIPEIEELPRPPNPREIIDLEANLESIENEIRELSANEVNLRMNFLSLTELKQVLVNTEGFFSNSELLNLDINRYIDPNDQNVQQGQRGQLGFVAGVIRLERFFGFERMLWRISRGNVFLKRNDLSEITKDPETGHSMQKTVFVAFFQGDQLQQRIKKVCTGFHAAVYPCPSSHAERDSMMNDVRLRLADLELVLNQTADHRSRVLVAAAKKMSGWTVMVKKMKAIYHTLNLFNMDLSNKCLIGEGWVPVKDLSVVQRALAQGSAEVESAIPSFLNVIGTSEQPPTYTRTNKFTSGFQNLIDAYGIASYREVNPALYTCITFPFLFAVMFGDMGHALILVIFASWMVISENKLGKIKGEIWKIFFGGRYIILLMGIFSLYTGFIYNDVFSKSMNIFGSSWRIRYNTTTVMENPTLQLMPDVSSFGTYPMGMDPIWQLGINKIIFLNTYKMKLSIIFGVLHMSFGVVMSLINFNFFKKRAYILLEFLPQLIFLVLLFGYMVFMMFFKWVKYSAQKAPPLSPGCAPSILIMFINMMLFKENKPIHDDCEKFMFEGQDIVQMVFVLVALICIPWMLLGKPLYIQFTRKRAHGHNENHHSAVENGHSNGINGKMQGEMPPIVAPAPVASASEAGVAGGHGHDDEPLGEVYIHQAIHTIEYVLSTISHTASYLRLWALSLAHAQLSEVLWDMVMQKSFIVVPGYGSAIMAFLIFWIWSALTVAILVLIEGLSAFLHTLRLHWVEFMSKFYEGVGYPFQPFCFKRILEDNGEE